MFLSNLAYNKGIIIVGASQSWSVSVEEQFYLIWPWFIILFRKRIFVVLVTFILFLVSFRYSLFIGNTLISFVLKIPFEYMGLGSIVGVLVFNNPRHLGKLLKINGLVLIVISVSFLLLFFPFPLIQGIVFSVFLLTMFYNQNNIKDLNVFDKLGEISYGIYMYHPLVMYFSFELVSKLFGLEWTWISSIGLYLSTFTITIFISKISYKYLESPLLRLKPNYKNI